MEPSYIFVTFKLSQNISLQWILTRHAVKSFIPCSTRAPVRVTETKQTALTVGVVWVDVVRATSLGILAKDMTTMTWFKNTRNRLKSRRAQQCFPYISIFFVNPSSNPTSLTGALYVEWVSYIINLNTEHVFFFFTINIHSAMEACVVGYVMK